MGRGDVDTWTELVVDVNSDGRVFELRVTQALTQADATANLPKQLLAALRLPDADTGKRPQHRGARADAEPNVPRRDGEGAAGRPWPRGDPPTLRAPDPSAILVPGTAADRGARP